MARSKSSNQWLQEHFSDPYVRRAQREGFRSRAVYKLMEIDQRDRLFSPGMTVVDLGAAPGGWSQYAARQVGARGRVVAMDVLPMEPLPGVDFIQGDFRDDCVLERLLGVLGGRVPDLVISDMAPNSTGVKAVDQPRGMYLAELAVEFSLANLRPGGALLSKLFQGEGFEALLKTLRGRFDSVATRKPKASRDRSPELYLLARNYRV